MKNIFVVIVLAVFTAGCVQTINLGLIASNNRLQEFFIDDYKMWIQITESTDNEYLYSISFFDKNENTSIKDVKSEIEIKKYPENPKTHYKHRHSKQTLVNGLKPIYDANSNDYDFRYKFSSKGKYESTIELSEINGKPLEKNLLISFDQVL
ncbi:MAG: hypothetical protein AB1521_10605 [Bacteroidota bacterium]